MEKGNVNGNTAAEDARKEHPFSMEQLEQFKDYTLNYLLKQSKADEAFTEGMIASLEREEDMAKLLWDFANYFNERKISMREYQDYIKLILGIKD